jgi:transcriptional regulator with XRE-family HTH domain
MGAIDYGAFLAQSISAERVADNLSQQDVAERMTNLGYSGWSAQTVADAETAKRPLAASEILGLSAVLSFSITQAIPPALPKMQADVTLPGGETVIVRLDQTELIVWQGNIPTEIPPPYEKSRHGLNIPPPDEKSRHG